MIYRWGSWNFIIIENRGVANLLCSKHGVTFFFLFEFSHILDVFTPKIWEKYGRSFPRCGNMGDLTIKLISLKCSHSSQRNCSLWRQATQGLQWLQSIRRRSDYIIGFVTPAIGPNKSKKLTRLIALAHNTRGKVWMKNSIHGFTENNLLSVKPCILCFIRTLPRVLRTGAISHVSFLDLFGPIAGVTNPIM